MKLRHRWHRFIAAIIRKDRLVIRRLEAAPGEERDYLDDEIVAVDGELHRLDEALALLEARLRAVDRTGTAA